MLALALSLRAAVCESGGRRRLLALHGSQHGGEVVRLDQHVAGLGAFGGAHHSPGLEQVHQAAGLGEPDAELALQHRRGAELRGDHQFRGLQQHLEVVADVVVDLLLLRLGGDVVAVDRP